MIGGASAILIGLFLYFGVNLVLRRSLALDGALLPAYQLRDTLQLLLTKVDAAEQLTSIPLSNMLSAFTTLDNQLTPQELSRHLPSLLATVYTSPATWQSDFTAYLTPLSDKAAALVVLVNTGIETAISYWPGHPPAVTIALTHIDPLALTATNAANAQTALAPILSALFASVNPPLVAAMPGANPANLAARLFTLPPDTHTLEVRLMRDTMLVWWVVALIALLGGFYALVLQNFGFGLATDYMKCLFWGLGFSVAGTQLDQLTQGTVLGNFGVTIPKA
jgi:hypothetical protein